jgi:hypothetical protein
MGIELLSGRFVFLQPQLLLHVITNFELLDLLCDQMPTRSPGRKPGRAS